jgi:hypothetical protein
MKLSKLREIIERAVKIKRDIAGYSGAWNDGGAGSLQSEFEDYKQDLIILNDLRPSEYGLLDDLEVGELSKFGSYIREYKLTLLGSIVL